MTTTPPPPREGQSHTPGTISVRRAPNAVARCTNIVSDKTGRDIALVCIRGEPDNEWQANAARLVDSWNACLPFPSPATDVPRLIEAARDNGGEPSNDINPDTRTFPEVLEHLASLMADKKWLTHMAKPGSKSAEGWAVLLRKKAEQLRAALPPEVRP